MANGKTLVPTKNIGLNEVIVRKYWLLDAEILCAEAKRRTGLEDFGDVAIESRLRIILNSIESEAHLHPVGRFLARMHFRNLLETRLQLWNAFKKLRSLDGIQVERPIFITGMPRSGSTYLHELFVQNEVTRAPLVWEVMFPPRNATPDQREIAYRTHQAEQCLWWFRQIAPRADSVHPMRATTPHECVAIHSYSLLSQEFATTFRIPTYSTYLNNVDLRPAYAWEKLFLEYLQWGLPTKRWVLKAPDHVFSLDALFSVFPDATIIQMHRNPADVLKSSLDLTEVLHRLFAYRQPRHESILREVQILADGMNRITGFRDSHPELKDRFIDIHYRELVSDPLTILRRLHWQMDLPWTKVTSDRIQAVVGSRGRYSGKRTRADAGVDAKIIKDHFTAYCSRFGMNPG